MTPTALAVLAELERRRGAYAQQSATDSAQLAAARARDAAALAAVVAELRAGQEQHPKQRAAFRSAAQQVAILASRRAGKTSGGAREDLACALERPKFRCTYCNSTKGEAEKLVWRSDTEDGWVDLLARYGTRDPRNKSQWLIGGITATVSESDLTISFSNGSNLEIFAADTAADTDKLRGRAKHRVRVDEAQKFPALAKFVRSVVTAVLKDFRGQLIIQGTPGEDCDGYFYDVTRPEDHGPRVIGWEVHEFGVTDNPGFGAVVHIVEAITGGWYVVDPQTKDRVAGPLATEAEADQAAQQYRWDRVVEPELRDKGLSLEDPDVQREWLRRWVRTSHRYVYAAHAAPTHIQGFAPLRISDSWRDHATAIQGGVPDEVIAILEDGWYDHAQSLLDLPRAQGRKRRSWMFGLGADFGHNPDPTAVSVLAFTHDLPDLFEMWSWKAAGLVPDDWRVIVELLYRQILDGLVAMVGDPGNGAGAQMVAWRERLAVPIEAADKNNKRQWQEMLNGTIRRGRFWYRKDSPLLDEHKHLIWMPSVPGRKPTEHADRALTDKRVPGNHCSDAALYISRRLTSHMHRSPPAKEEVLAREEREAESAVDRRAARRGSAALDTTFEDDGWTQLG